MQADAGITGVNFAIAETGGFVVCTNEGNADLGVSLPKLHIACMGIEKLIPKLHHLGVFLRLLARSATGQPITTYSSHFHGPRPGGELHIVLVDNGRSEMLASDEFRRSLNCIRCGACMNTCPVYRRSGGHSYETTVPGPIGSVLAPALDAEKHASLPFACRLCGSCTDVCPVKIPTASPALGVAERVGRRETRSLRQALRHETCGTRVPRAVVVRHRRLARPRGASSLRLAGWFTIALMVGVASASCRRRPSEVFEGCTISETNHEREWHTSARIKEVVSRAHGSGAR